MAVFFSSKLGSKLKERYGKNSDSRRFRIDWNGFGGTFKKFGSRGMDFDPKKF
ncbi:hypothetical protein D3C85_1505110 [compost metagenome]